MKELRELLYSYNETGNTKENIVLFLKLDLKEQYSFIRFLDSLSKGTKYEFLVDIKKIDSRALSKLGFFHLVLKKSEIRDLIDDIKRENKAIQYGLKNDYIDYCSGCKKITTFVKNTCSCGMKIYESNPEGMINWESVTDEILEKPEIKS